ncbi:MAG: Wzz/FepE/Etk N-terminal domain-containing protein, partial [Thermodesulfobacteriota bacterium]|nr:Wzz/FepE/Etk N-terminal domain-containing protein [Thermodesulfobacteriota bacterium]
MEENNQGRDYYEDEIDLYELMGVLWKKKGLIVFIVAISVICAGVYAYSGSRAITEEMVKLSFSGIDKHLYPDGSAFDMHDLIAPDILEKASKGIEDPEHRQAFMENPRSYCFVKPFIPVEITAEIERMEKEKKTFIYLPTQFHLQFIETKDRPFGTQEKDRLLLGIKTAYVDKFKKNFINPKILALALSKDAFSRLDYIDQIDCLDKQVRVYVSFLDDRIEDAGHYRSIDTGDSFVDILNSLNNLMDNELNETTSVIDTLRLTKDRQIL